MHRSPSERWDNTLKKNAREGLQQEQFRFHCDVLSQDKKTGITHNQTHLIKF